jgi:hypothetical protein
MKKILWISRHPLDKEAVKALADKYNDTIGVETKNVLFPATPEEAWEVFKKETEGFDIIGFVAPAQLQVAIFKHLANGGKLGKTGFFVISVPAIAEDGQTRIFKFSDILFFDF